MKDSDFQRVLNRFSQYESNHGGQIIETTADAYRSKACDFREWLAAGKKKEEGEEWEREPKEIEEANFLDIEGWYGELDRHYNSDAPINKAKGALGAFYDIAEDFARGGEIDIDGWGHETPADRASYTPENSDTMKSRETREDMHWLEPHQVRSLWKNAEKDRDKLIIRLIYQTGVRVSELCNIRWPQDVDLERQEIHIQGKGRKNRDVLWQDNLNLLMEIWIEEGRPSQYCAKDSEFLFPTNHSEQITRQTVGEIVKKAAKEAGIQETYGPNADGNTLHVITPHVLRHSFAMATLKYEDWDIYTLSQALGHEDTEITTSTYLHDDKEQVRRAYKTRGPTSAD